jgi:hypothetical protein
MHPAFGAAVLFHLEQHESPWPSVWKVTARLPPTTCGSFSRAHGLVLADPRQGGDNEAPLAGHRLRQLQYHTAQVGVAQFWRRPQSGVAQRLEKYGG